MSGIFIREERLGCDQTLFLQGADSLCADLHRHLFAINNDGLSLEVWLPNFLGVTLRKADIAAELLALAGDFTFLHNLFLYSRCNYSPFYVNGQLRPRLLY